MKISDFKLERYFAKYEFCTKYLLSSSDCDGYAMSYVLSCAGQEELDLWNNLKLGYTDSAGSRFLREAIAEQYCEMTVDNILVSSPGEANFSFMNVFLKPGDEVICMRPAYQSLYQVAESLGCRVKFWEVRQQGSAYSFELEDLEPLITSKTRLLIVNFPHNPTGYSPSLPQLKAMVDLAREHNIFIFSDEMYFQLCNPEERIPAVCDLYENALSLWGMAKSFGLAGLRFGWAASARKDILAKMMAFKDYLSICNNAAGEVLSCIALRHKGKFIGPNLDKITRNRELFLEFSRKNHKFIGFTPPASGSTALVELKSKPGAYEYGEMLVQETGIMLVPSEMFDFGNRHIRIGFGREIMPETLRAWQKYIDDHPELAA